MGKAVTLWDIDGTLVDVFNCHTRRYQGAMKEIYCISPQDEEIEAYYGLPARETIAGPLRDYKIPEQEIQRGVSDILERVSKNFETEVEKKAIEGEVVLPGVREIITKLKERDITLGIVTGNIKKNGEAILRSAGLYSFFDTRISSYGDEITDRAKIVERAISRARENGLLDKDTRVYVFGDTLSDIKAAKENNCISVVTINNSNQKKTEEEFSKRKRLLEEANPDFLVEDFTKVEALLSALEVN